MSEDRLQGLDDAELVAQAKKGEMEAFGVLYERYIAVIYRYIRSKVWEDQVAEDLSEQTFLRAFEKIDRYRERGKPLSAYLYRIARNIVVDHYRMARAEVQLHESQIVDHESVDLERKIVEMEEADALQVCLELLPENYQEVIRLRVMLGVPTQSVSEMIGKSEGATRVLLHRALKALRAKWESRNV